MEGSPTKRGRGRPRKPAEEGKRHTMTIRLGVDLRNLVEQAANKQGRPLALEVEARLARSFDTDQALGPIENAKFLRLIAASSDSFGQLIQQLAAVKNAVETRTNGSFDSDPATFWAVRKGMLDLIDRKMPDEADLALEELLESDDLEDLLFDDREAWESIGIEVARAVCPTPRRHSGLIAPNNTE